VDTLAAYPAVQAVLLGNHGVLVFSASPGEAAARLTVLEEAAEAELAAGALGGAVDFPAGALEDGAGPRNVTSARARCATGSTPRSRSAAP
jgi:ribulose-5-phosphate 4-epimerase/fuculose-1-phosphate aldolase